MFEFVTQSVTSFIKGGDDLDFDFDLPLFLTLTIGLGILFVVLLTLTIYFTFFSGEGSISLGSNFNIPGEFDDEQGLINDEEEFLPKFTAVDKKAYLQGKQFQERFPPVTKALGTTLTESEMEFIADRGIQAYQFIQPLEYGTSGQPAVLVEDKLDIHFLSIHEANSAILNYPLPLKFTAPNDTVYFEVKFFEKPAESLVSVGLVSKPYPLFRLPGYNKYSIAYETNGTIRVNQPFYSPDIWNKVQEGDVVGVGFKCKSGTIFFTHNGKKVTEVVHNVKFDLYPAIGSIGEAKVSVNLGQLGFVFIEANVKKWGFGSVFGTIGVPPAYGNDHDKVLDKGEELPPHYPQEEDTFFGPSALLQSATSNAATTEVESPVEASKPTKIISNPPSYTEEPKEELSKSADEFKKVSSASHERVYESQTSAFEQNHNEQTGEPSEIAASSSAAQLEQAHPEFVGQIQPTPEQSETEAPIESTPAAAVVEEQQEKQQQEEEETTEVQEAQLTPPQSSATDSTVEAQPEETTTTTTTTTTQDDEEAEAEELNEDEIEAAASPALPESKGSSTSSKNSKGKKKNSKKKKKKGKK
ncbi:hypothetical protein WICPIJ_000681 [Wickerhamomyces pijperi]|uniref:B30.2/SPRY domain-containing protein n=1 Tax=Wickerhamomyces pijperi TaxID=599730 RepID=A0A9P8QCC5_WICPI|nr:hypothetical protein WICPIJ_000681 [Wickerhamomyces pijperi]